MQPQGFRDRVVPALVAAGADVNAKSAPGCGWSNESDRTPLMLAAEHGAATLMRTLIEAKADQTAVDDCGSTAVGLLLAALKLENGNVGHALQVSAANVNMRNKVWSSAPSGRALELKVSNHRRADLQLRDE